jgi:Concanavalin A-like lectin/glucanases superfamily
VIGIIVAIAAPSLLGQTRVAQDLQAKQDIRHSLLTAQRLYNDNEGFYPSQSVLLSYMRERRPELSYDTTVTTAKKIRVQRFSDSSVEFCKQSQSGLVFCARTDGTGSLMDLKAGSDENVLTAYSHGFGSTLAAALTAASCVNDNAAGDSKACPGGYPGWDNDGNGQFAPVADSEPASNTAPPQITGTPEAGSELSASTGTWNNYTGSYAYQWQISDDNITFTDIASKTTAQYLVAQSDIGKHVRVQVSAGEVAVTSSAVDIRTYEQSVLADNPAGYWRMRADNGAGSIVSGLPSGQSLFLAQGWTDSTNSSTRNGLCNSQSCKQPSPIVTDPSDYSTAFDGTGSGRYAYATDSAALSLTDDFTLEAWVKTAGENNGGAGQNIITKCDQGTYHNGYVMRIGSSDAFQGGSYSATNSDILSSNLTPQNNTWYHVVLVTEHDGASPKQIWYVNGEQQATATATAWPTDGTSELRIGADCANTGSKMHGNIDEVAVYDTALSPQRVQAHFKTSGAQ